MLSNRLRHRVAVQEQVETQNATTGAVTVVWQNVVINTIELNSVPAEVLTGQGRETFLSDSRQNESAARINMRWFEGLTQKMRIVWEGKEFNIQSIETDVTARREYRLKCVTGMNDGQ